MPSQTIKITPATNESTPIASTMEDARENLKSCCMYNVKYLRDSIFGCPQRDFASLLGLTHPTISSWERGKSIPQPEDVVALIEYMKATPKLRNFATFNLDQFYRSYLDFDNIPAEESDARYSYIEGSYVLTYLDFSEKNTSPDATTTYKTKLAIMVIYRKPASLGRLKNDSPLGIYVIPFTDRAKALSFKKELDESIKRVQGASAPDMARAVDCVYQDYCSQNNISPCHLYRGYANVFDNLHVNCVFENGNTFAPTTDRVSLYFSLPHHTSKPSFIGGMSVMLSLTGGSDALALAQRVIVSRSEIHRSDEILIESFLKATDKKVTVSAKLYDVLALYDRFKEENSPTASALGDAEVKTIIVNLIESIYTSAYKEHQFFSLDNADPDGTDQTYQLLKHHTSSEKF